MEIEKASVKGYDVHMDEYIIIARDRGSTVEITKHNNFQAYDLEPREWAFCKLLFGWIYPNKSLHFYHLPDGFRNSYKDTSRSGR